MAPCYRGRVVKREIALRKAVVKRGIVLGLQASIVASALFWVVVFVSELLVEESTQNKRGNPYGYGVFVILVLATIIVSLLPGIIGGAANAYLLSRLASSKRLTRAASITSGLLVGFLAGFATIFGVALKAGPPYDLAGTVQFALVVACVAAPVGGWHGWRVGKWLLAAEG